MWQQVVVQNKSLPIQRFDGIRAIQKHVDQRYQVEAYVQGYSSNRPVLPKECCEGCKVGKWLHSEGGKHADVALLNALHDSCFEFYEAASQALMLVEMGKRDEAIRLIRGSKYFKDASDRYQANLAKLHLLSEMS